MERIPRENRKFNYTYRLDINGAGHLNANRFVQQIQRLRAEHLLDDDIFSEPRAIGDVACFRI